MATKSALTAPKKHEKRENHTKREQRDEKKNTKNTLKRSNGQSTAKSHRKQFTCGSSGGLQRGSAWLHGWKHLVGRLPRRVSVSAADAWERWKPWKPWKFIPASVKTVKTWKFPPGNGNERKAWNFTPWSVKNVKIHIWEREKTIWPRKRDLDPEMQKQGPERNGFGFRGRMVP